MAERSGSSFTPAFEEARQIFVGAGSSQSQSSRVLGAESCRNLFVEQKSSAELRPLASAVAAVI
jgi:hypothetical protein